MNSKQVFVYRPDHPAADENGMVSKDDLGRTSAASRRRNDDIADPKTKLAFESPSSTSTQEEEKQAIKKRSRPHLKATPQRPLTTNSSSTASERATPAKQQPIVINSVDGSSRGIQGYPSVIFKTLDGMERRLDAMHFLFVFMAAEFVILIFGSSLQFVFSSFSFGISISRTPYPTAATFVIDWLIPPVLLFILWAFYRYGPRYVLVGTVAFVSLFFFVTMFAISALYVTTRLNLMYVDMRLGLERVQFEQSPYAWMG
jgi:hypothetical protein